MHSITRPVRLAIGVLAVVAAAGSLTACSGGSSPGGGGDGAKLTQVAFWDPYPQYDASSDWGKYVAACAPSGTKIVRTTAPNTDLINNLTTAVRSDKAPDVVFLDNPAVPTAAAAGLLAPIDETGLTKSDADSNLAGPGTVDGKTYGSPIGVNTLGLYYNEDILKKAGVDPSSITDWTSLNAALEKVTKGGDKGITFAGLPGEEGTFQFLPWFWGAGASFDKLDSSAAISAGQLVSDWIAKGYAPKSAINDNQSQSWDNFLTGDYAFAENGSWFAVAATKEKFPIKMMPIPGKTGGAAPVPTGAEFGVVPVHKDNAQAHYAAAKHVIDCLLGSKNQIKTADMLGYFSANKAARTEQISSQPAYSTWTDAVNNARGRTTELGTKYLQTSAAISKAEQDSENAGGDSSKIAAAFKSAAQSAQG